VLSSSDPHSISVSADGRRLAYSKFTVAQNIWSVPIPQAGVVSIQDAVPITSGNQVIEGHDLSPDGEWIAFTGDARGGLDIYRMPLGGGPPQLVSDLTVDVFAPDWSPDDTEITVFSGRESPDVLNVSVDDGTTEQLTDFPGFDIHPDWSPDGLAIAFMSEGPQDVRPWNIWIVSRDSVGLPWSEPVQLTDFGCGDPEWAPDGASLACRLMEDLVWVRVSRNGDVLSRYDASDTGLQSIDRLRFSVDGSRIYVIATGQDGSAGVWWIPENGGEATKVVAFDDPSLTVPGFFTVGPEQLYLTVAEYESDIWVMDVEVER
jgi:Tol biopolymer transport system component